MGPTLYTQPGRRVLGPALGTIAARCYVDNTPHLLTALHVLVAKNLWFDAIDAASSAFRVVEARRTHEAPAFDLALFTPTTVANMHGAPLGTNAIPALLPREDVVSGQKVLIRPGQQQGWAVATVEQAVQPDQRFALHIDPTPNAEVRHHVPQNTSIGHLVDGDSGSPVYAWRLVNQNDFRLRLAGVVLQASSTGALTAVHPGDALALFGARLEKTG